MRRVTLFWPGDGRPSPNERALPSVRATTSQLEKSLRKLGREPRVIEQFLSKPHESIEQLGRLDEPLIGVCVHWFYAPHTTDWERTHHCCSPATSRVSGQA
jgi:hypothetical protein